MAARALGGGSHGPTGARCGRWRNAAAARGAAERAAVRSSKERQIEAVLQRAAPETRAEIEHRLTQGGYLGEEKE